MFERIFFGIAILLFIFANSMLFAEYNKIMVQVAIVCTGLALGSLLKRIEELEKEIK